MSEAQPCRYLRLNAFSAAIHCAAAPWTGCTTFGAICTDFLVEKRGTRFVVLALSLLMKLTQYTSNCKMAQRHGKRFSSLAY